jgi:CHAT domain-containing protein
MPNAFGTLRLCHLLICFTTLIALTASACGQLAIKPSEASSADTLRDLKPGVVVEEVNKNSTAAEAGWQRKRGGEVYLPRLQFTRREAEVIAALTPAGQSWEALDFKANRANATSRNLANYRIVHFATHALLNSKHPELSGLVLSLVNEQGKPQNGFLGLQDIYNLNLPVDMVVLSACETGLGKEIRGEGLVGLTSGFMYAGATRVVASLWNVDDAATSELMGRFYKGILKDGLQPAAALQRTQIEMRKQKRWRAPHHWAGFVLQGQW